MVLTILGRKAMTNPRQWFKKQRHYFADKGPYNQSYNFSSSHVRMWEQDNKKGRAPKNWCLRIVVLEKTLESPLTCKEIKPVHPKDQSWVFIGRTDAEADAPILWSSDAKNYLIREEPDCGKGWRQEAKGVTEDEMVGWYHQLNRHKLEQTPGDGEGQGSLACWSPWGCRESHTTERLNYNNRWSYVQGSKRDTDVKNRLLDSMGEDEGGMIWENSIETYTSPYVK